MVIGLYWEANIWTSNPRCAYGRALQMPDVISWWFFVYLFQLLPAFSLWEVLLRYVVIFMVSFMIWQNYSGLVERYHLPYIILLFSPFSFMIQSCTLLYFTLNKPKLILTHFSLFFLPVPWHKLPIYGRLCGPWLLFCRNCVGRPTNHTFCFRSILKLKC